MGDPRTTPAYTTAEAARLLGMQCATLRVWLPPNKRCDATGRYLNFFELLQASVIKALRSRHKISMQKINRGLRYLREATGEKYPFAIKRLNIQFDSSGIHFVDKFGDLICASQDGQKEIKEVLQRFLQRLDYDAEGNALRFFPLTQDGNFNSPKYVVIDPRLNFGRPCLFGRGISTSMIAKRHKAGESFSELADDYSCQPDMIEEAVRAEYNPSPLAA